MLALGKSRELEDEEDDGGEFVFEGEEEKDDEETIAAEEKLHEGDNYASELDDLQKEGMIIHFPHKPEFLKTLFLYFF